MNMHASMFGPNYSARAALKGSHSDTRTRLWNLGLAALCTFCILWGSTALRPFLPPAAGNERFVWAMADGLVVLWVLMRPVQVLRVAQANLVLISWGLLACLSAMWSLAPTQSAYFGLQLLFTILAGLMLTTWTTRLHLVQMVFLALVGTQVISLIVEFAMPGLRPGFPGGGAFTHKNILGNAMTLQLITSGCLFLAGWRRLLTGGAFALAAALLVYSDSASALLTALVIVGVLLPAGAIYRLSPRSALIGVAGALITGAVALFVLPQTDFNTVKFVLEALGKDATLTGRTDLWQFAEEAIRNYPWLGHGYRGYWESEETSKYLLRYVLQQDLWFFHNNYLEVAVAFGLGGPVLLVLGLVVAFWRRFTEFLAGASMMALWGLAFVIYVAALAMAENPLFENHGLMQVIFVIAMAARDTPSGLLSMARPRGSRRLI
jgi:O-antigen ligase